MSKYMLKLSINAYTYSSAAKNKAPEGLYSWNMESYTPLITAHILYQDSNQIARIKEINELQKATDFCANSRTMSVERNGKKLGTVGPDQLLEIIDGFTQIIGI